MRSAEGIWGGRSLTAALARAALSPLSLLYRAALALRPAPRPRSAGPFTISIGNIQAGGTGKTPHVIALARRLAEKGLRPAVVSRGYGGSLSRRGAIVSDGREILLSWEEAGDEPVLIARSLPGIPVVIGADRLRAAERAVSRFKPDIIIADDAFQHRRLARELDIVLLDISRDPFRDRLLPAGRLREPIKALARADCVLLSGGGGGGAPGTAEVREEIRRLVPEAPPIFETRLVPSGVRPIGTTVKPVALLGRGVVAFSGIGNPASFSRSLAEAGAEVEREISFPDHHRFSDSDILSLERALNGAESDLAVTTAKDAVRLPAVLPFPCAVLETTAEIEDSGQQFIDNLIPSL